MFDEISDFNILLEQFKNGDQQAFDEIYRRCYGQIKFLCSKLCSNKEDVEEVVQDTFLTAFKKVDELRADTFLALLRKIAVRRCYDKHKSNKRRSAHIAYSNDENNFEVEELDQNFLPEEYLQNKELRYELLQVINDLPPKQREMIYLYYYANINTEEIARLHNCPSVNVRNILSTARKTIKSKIEDRAKVPGYGRMAGISIGAVLFVEEQAFVASIVIANIATFSAVATTATVAATTVTTGGMLTIAACAVGVVAISALVYFASSPEAEVYDVPEPAIEISTPAPQVPEYEIYENEYIPPLEYIPQEASVPFAETEPEEDIPKTYEPELEPETLPETFPEIPEIAPNLKPEAEPDPIPEPDDELESEDEPKPEPDDEPEPLHIDRTAEILAALAIASTDEDVRRIINRYGFSLSTQMRTYTTETWFWFYVLDDGSGDILVGIAATDDGNDWRMRFEHFADGQMNLDRADLFRWMG